MASARENPRSSVPAGTVRKLAVVHAALRGCRACEGVVGPVVHGPPIPSRIFLLGQAPGAHEGKLGRPFAWTAGKTLFRWFDEALGVPEELFRARIYMSAVLRCFPGKAKGGGDRRPSPAEVLRCRPHLTREIEALAPRLVIPVGTLAIEAVLGHKGPLVDVVGALHQTSFHGADVDVVPLPHPSGASTWHRTEPGRTLLAEALALLARHPEMRPLAEEGDRLRKLFEKRSLGL